jgi:hypothetical protein
MMYKAAAGSGSYYPTNPKYSPSNPHPLCGKPCFGCGRLLDWRGKCHECLNDQFLNEEYDAYSESEKVGE